MITDDRWELGSLCRRTAAGLQKEEQLVYTSFASFPDEVVNRDNLSAWISVACCCTKSMLGNVLTSGAFVGGNLSPITTLHWM